MLKYIDPAAHRRTNVTLTNPIPRIDPIPNFNSIYDAVGKCKEKKENRTAADHGPAD